MLNGISNRLRLSGTESFFARFYELAINYNASQGPLHSRSTTCRKVAQSPALRHVRCYSPSTPNEARKLSNTWRPSRQAKKTATSKSKADIHTLRQANKESDTTMKTESELSKDVREIMSYMPHSVVVVTSSQPAHEISDQKLEPRAMTISSFTSVSLEDEPIVTFNIRQGSATLRAIAESRRFNIHILGDTERGAAIAHEFTRGSKDYLSIRELSVEERKKQGYLVHPGVGLEPPTLSGRGILRVLKCKSILEPIPIKTHAIVLGKVVSIEKSSDPDNDVSGLGYARRKYRRIGSEMEPRPRPPFGPMIEAK